MKLIAKPAKENIKTYVPMGLFLVFLSFADTKKETPTIVNKIKNAVLILHCSASG